MQLVIEVTETFESQLNTGIQRVVRRVCKELADLDQVRENPPILVVSSRSSRGAAYLLRAELLEQPTANFAGVSSVWNSRVYILLSRTWKLLSRRGFSRVLNSKIVHSLSGFVVRGIHRNQSAKLPPPDEYTFSSNDALLIIDAFWGNPDGLLLAQRAKDAGSKIVLLLNDVFPVSHPELCDKNNVDRFTKLAGTALEMADYVLYPSDTTKNEITKHFGSILSKKPHQKIPYGHDGVPTQVVSRRDLQEVRIKNSICVLGTIEPRKNYELIFDWFISRERYETKLTFIGKPGWLTESLQRRLRLEQQTNPNFTWHESASDELLAHELNRHEIGVMASLAEGFGLPVVEMSKAGLKLVLSDIPIFREVAGEAAKYFNPDSIEELDAAIALARNQFDSPKIPEVTWKDTATSITKAVNAL